jgi:toxin ParE1/3/4
MNASEKRSCREFVGEVDTALARIVANPEQYEVVHREIRHAILRRFPYGVFYSIRASRISVFAVLHLKRDEIQWKV